MGHISDGEKMESTLCLLWPFKIWAMCQCLAEVLIGLMYLHREPETIKMLVHLENASSSMGMWKRGDREESHGLRRATMVSPLRRHGPCHLIGN